MLFFMWYALPHVVCLPQYPQTMNQQKNSFDYEAPFSRKDFFEARRRQIWFKDTEVSIL